MKNLINVTAGILAALLIVTPCDALGKKDKKDKQDGKRSERSDGNGSDKKRGEKTLFSEKFLERLDKQLDLTKEQKTEIQDIIEASKPGFESKKAEMKAAMEAMKKYLLESKERVRGTLTLEQKSKFDQMMMRQQMMHKMRKMRQSRMGGQGMRGRQGGPGGPGMQGRQGGPRGPGMQGRQGGMGMSGGQDDGPGDERMGPPQGWGFGEQDQEGDDSPDYDAE